RARARAAAARRRAGARAVRKRSRARRRPRGLPARARGQARRRARGAHAARVRLAVLLREPPGQGVLARRAARPRLGPQAQRLRAHGQHAHQPDPREDRNRRGKSAAHPHGLGPRLQARARRERVVIRLTLSARLSLVFCALLLASSAAAAWLTIRANRLLEQELVQRLSSDVAEHIADSAQFMDENGLRPDAVRILFDQLMSVNPSVEVYLLDA